MKYRKKDINQFISILKSEEVSWDQIEDLTEKNFETIIKETFPKELKRIILENDVSACPILINGNRYEKTVAKWLLSLS